MIGSPVRRKRRVWASLGALTLLVAVAPAPRLALADVGQPQPVITQWPEISGTAQVGQTLTSTPGAWEGLPPITATYQWLRCSESLPNTCSSIAGATGLSYAPVTADVGQLLRIRLTVTNSFGEDAQRSDPTSTVTPAPEPTPEPAPSPTPEPPPSPSPVPGQSPTPDPPPASTGGPAPTSGDLETSTPAPTSGVLGASTPAPTSGVLGASTPPRLLNPFPVVRIRGRLTGPGAQVTLLTVRAPRRARIAVSCSGAGCPTRRWARTAALTRVRAFEHMLPAGVHLTVTVTATGRIGKHTLIVIRRGRQPLRRDRCLYPGSTRPRPCPAS